MPLNYSKWDALELSDDSDIEGHPNVDHKSLVNWKRRDIHEKRAARNFRIESLKAEIQTNDILMPRLRTITEEVHNATDGPAQFSRIVEQLKTNPSPDAPQAGSDAGVGPGSKRLTYDEMILSLLMKVYDDAREKGVGKGSGNEARLQEELVKNLKVHITKLGERQETIKKELEIEEGERSKKITSESLHDGFDASHIASKEEPKPLIKGKTKTQKVTDVEVLNPKAVENAQAAQLASKFSPSGPSATPGASDEADDEEANEIPEMTPILDEFAKLPLRGYSQSFEFIQKHRDVYVPGASDALFVAGFRAQRAGDAARAKRCIHQSMLLQYCEKLGKDGVGLFFQRMLSGDPRAEKVFRDDFESTYAKMVERVAVMNAEEAEAGDKGEEKIQLVAQGEGTEIRFNVPDGPPPEELRLEGPELENVDVEEVRHFLTTQWEIFEGFSDEMKAALKSGKLDDVNKVLEKMDVGEAENVVGLLDSSGILNVSGGVVDATGKDEALKVEAD